MIAPYELFLLCQKAVMEKASDIHLKPGSKPFCRDRNGVLRPIAPDNADSLSNESISGLLEHLYPDKSGAIRTTFTCPQALSYLLTQDIGEADASAVMPLPSGFSANLRINAFFGQTGLNLAIRVLRTDIMSAKDIWLPISLQELIRKKEGLIIFCGATGSGKTTAMYSLLDIINHEDSKHIITLDDPLEIVLQEEKCFVSQREIGVHARSFDQALRAALREDPDILLVGEMRDRDTIRIALQAAETGHLVLSTIHASSVSEVVDRVVSYFSADEAVQLRTALAASFLGIVGCKLLPRKGGGRVGAFEVLLRSTATTAVIKNGNMAQISDYMSQKYGMQTMEQSIDTLRAMHVLEDSGYG